VLDLWSKNDSRRTYTCAWYDLLGRKLTEADYGDNGSAALTRPSLPPAPNGSDNILITAHTFNPAGDPFETTDNKGRKTRRVFDDVGHVVQTIENYVDGTPGESDMDTDRLTETLYDSAGRMSQLIAHNPKGAGLGVEQQVTRYVYGTNANLSSPAIWRNDLLVAEIYPDSDDVYIPEAANGSKLGNGPDGTYDRVQYTYDYASRRLTVKEQRGVVRTFYYDSYGRYYRDKVTTLPSGVDGYVRQIDLAFDSLSRVQYIRGYNGSTKRNEVKVTYDGWGNQITDEQAHAGSVGTGTPAYQVAYEEGAVGGEAKYVRVASCTYPNGRVVYRTYGSAGSAGDRIGRLQSLADDASGAVALARYTYLGAAGVVRVAHPQVSGGLNLDYGTNGDPTGWDRLGRVTDQKWVKDGGTNVMRHQHAYDRTGNVRYRDDLVLTSNNDE
jgi:hypothetical protein